MKNQVKNSLSSIIFVESKVAFSPLFCDYAGRFYQDKWPKNGEDSGSGISKENPSTRHAHAIHLYSDYS